jgi:hypothetical protein
MEQREEARWQEEARRLNEQRQRCIKTSNYVDVETDNGVAGGGTVAVEVMAHDEQQRRRCVDTTDEDFDDVGNDDNVVPIFAIFYWLFYPSSGWGSQ